MLAPIDARAEVKTGDETIVLHLNFRTLALAKAAGVNLLLVGLSEIDPIDMARVIEAFAQPEHEGFTAEQAFALIVQEPKACMAALTKLAGEFAVAGGASKHPTTPRRQKSAQPTS